MHARPIYVCTDIAGPIEQVWHLTQTPAEHVKWDVRFTDIDYLPRPDPAEPQRFLYVTRIGFGLAIRGWGETAGSHDAADGSRSSALKFASDDSKSLIREGSGYWKYQPLGDGTRFLTRYDYAVRFGVIGRVVDGLVFRPIMGRATAWSFDRLRMWIEQDVPPSVAMRMAVLYTLARLGVAGVWLYHGLVPKLLFRHADERAMLADLGVSIHRIPTATVAAGLAEVILGMIVLFSWRSRWPLWLTAIGMPLTVGLVALFSPRFLVTAFNVVTLNLATMLLAITALLTLDFAPSAGRCGRRPEGD